MDCKDKSKKTKPERDRPEVDGKEPNCAMDRVEGEKPSFKRSNAKHEKPSHAELLGKVVNPGVMASEASMVLPSLARPKVEGGNPTRMWL